jgi:hypothetical protein
MKDISELQGMGVYELRMAIEKSFPKANTWEHLFRDFDNVSVAVDWLLKNYINAKGKPNFAEAVMKFDELKGKKNRMLVHLFEFFLW